MSIITGKMFNRSIMTHVSIKSFVVVDIEATGLPAFEFNKTKITELSLIALSADSMTSVQVGIPRVLNKLTVCVRPFRLIQPDSTRITGLSNDMLENEKTFDEDLGEILHLFLRRLAPPVCLVAHNGLKYDFPIIQSELLKVGKPLPHDVFCVDSYPAFQELFSNIPLNLLPLYQQKIIARNKRKKSNEPMEVVASHGYAAHDASTIAEDRTFMQAINEMTPEKPENNGETSRTITMQVTPQKSQQNDNVLHTIKAKRRLFDPVSNIDTAPSQLQSFKLADIYKFLHGRDPPSCHRAENDCLILLHCMTMMGMDFINWANSNAILFNNVKKLW